MTLILNAQYQFISKGGYSRNTLAAVTKTRCVTVHGGSVSPASRAQGERQRVVAVAVHVVGDRAKHDAAAIVGVDLLLLAGAAMNVGSSPWLNDDAVALPPVHFDGILGVDGSLRRVTLTGGPVAAHLYAIVCKAIFLYCSRSRLLGQSGDRRCHAVR